MEKLKKMDEKYTKELEKEFLEKARIYIANDILVTREIFIKEISFVLYDELFDPQTIMDALFTHLDVETNLEGDILGIRAIIDEMIRDTNEGTVVINDKIFSSYLEVMVNETEEFPMKKFKVTHDVLVQPAIRLRGARDKYKRVEAYVDATSFAEARAKFRAEFERLNPGRKYKRIKVEEYVPKVEAVEGDAMKPNPVPEEIEVIGDDHEDEEMVEVTT